MSKKQLPVAPAGRPCARVTCETLPSALDRWNGGIKAAATDDNSISVFDVIGQDYWGEGVTAKRIAGALRAMNGADVTVNINSPGGDMFEGLAIYNLLREYQGKVTVKVLGIAASAASVIAMAGDDIQIGRGAFLMIHNCWVVAMGNRHDFAELSASLEPFDNAIADIYAARSGLDMASVQKLMDAESYIGGSDAVEKGLADSLLSADAVSDGDETPAAALRKLDALLAKSSTPRSERRKLIKALSGGMSGAATNLENELTYQNVTMNPEAAQLLESRSFSIEEICRWFRVPPFMVGHTTKQSSWASSLEGMNLQFLTHTLRPLLVNIEQEIGRCLLDSDNDVFAEFSVEGLLRADSAGRAAYYTSALQNGWMSRNDVRRLENMPPIEGGDIYTVQLNLTQLKNLESSNPAVQALALRELHNHVFPDISFEQSPLKQAA
ncbi:head maturation protease, ClpP-related [Salmonella enterica]